ncbi:MAG: hypothetical protein ACOYMQ_18675, partial [Pseudanabaena sp.]
WSIANFSLLSYNKSETLPIPPHALNKCGTLPRMLQDKTLIELNKLLGKMIEKFDYDEERSFGYMLKVLQKGIFSLNPKA